MIHIRRAVAAQIVVISFGVIINLPLFLKHDVHNVNGTYYPYPSSYKHKESVMLTHHLCWFVVGTFTPLGLIVASNVRIIVELYNARHAQAVAGSTRPKHEKSTISRLTLTLIVISVSFFLLVCPSMILEFVVYTEKNGKQAGGQNQHQMAMSITNLAQAIKFSSNFILYCVINRTFRRMIGRAMRMSCCRRHGSFDGGDVVTVGAISLRRTAGFSRNRIPSAATYEQAITPPSAIIKLPALEEDITKV